MSNDPNFDHIDINDKEKVIARHLFCPWFFTGCLLVRNCFSFHLFVGLKNECVEAENWLRENKQQEDSQNMPTLVIRLLVVLSKESKLDRGWFDS